MSVSGELGLCPVQTTDTEHKPFEPGGPADISIRIPPFRDGEIEACLSEVTQRVTSTHGKAEKQLPFQGCLAVNCFSAKRTNWGVGAECGGVLQGGLGRAPWS